MTRDEAVRGKARHMADEFQQLRESFEEWQREGLGCPLSASELRELRESCDKVIDANADVHRLVEHAKALRELLAQVRLN